MAADSARLEHATEIFCEVMGVDRSAVSDATSYATFEPWDSLSHLELVARLEEAFGVTLDAEDVIAMETLGRLRQIVARCAGQS